MTRRMSWAIGVDLGGTKIKAAGMNTAGSLLHPVLLETDVEGGAAAVRRQIADAVSTICRSQNSVEQPQGVCVGVPGQIDEERGIVRFAPNLAWSDGE